MELDQWKLKHSHPEARSPRNKNRMRLVETNTFVPKKTSTATSLGKEGRDSQELSICEDESERVKQEPENDANDARPHSPTIQSNLLPLIMKQEQTSPSSVLEQGDSPLFSLIHRGSMYRTHEHRVTKLPPCIPLLEGQKPPGKSLPLPDNTASGGNFKVEDMDTQPYIGSSSSMFPLSSHTALPEEPVHTQGCLGTTSAVSASNSMDVTDDMNAELTNEQLRPSPIPFDQVSAEPPISFLLRVLDEDERKVLFESFPPPSKVAKV